MNESWCFEEFADELWKTNSDNYLGDCNIFEIILSHIQGPPNRCSHNSECSPVRTNRSCIRFSKKFVCSQFGGPCTYQRDPEFPIQHFHNELDSYESIDFKKRIAVSEGFQN